MNTVTVSMKRMIEEIAPHYGISPAFIERSASSDLKEGKDCTVIIRDEVKVMIPNASIEQYFNEKPKTKEGMDNVFKLEDFEDAFPTEAKPKKKP